MISENGRQAAIAEETAAVFLHTLKIEVEGFETLYFVDNIVPIMNAGIEYSPCAFRVVLPAQTDDGTARPCRLEIDNVDRGIDESIQKAKGKQIIVSVSVVIAQNPSIVERGPLRFILRNVTITKATVSGELYDFYIYDRKIPEGVYNPQDFPGLF